MSELEGIGEAATGAMLARTVEPRAGEAGAEGDGHTHERFCLNCETRLAGNYCHACGQKAHVHRTLTALWHDLAHSVMHFDGKLWRTLPLLAWRPGELTRRFIQGERARFVSPIALFLFSVFLMFAVFSTLGGPVGRDGSVEEPLAAPQQRQQQQQALAEAQAEIRELEAERRQLLASGRPTAAVDREIAARRMAFDLSGRIVDRATATGEGANATIRTESGGNAELTLAPTGIGFIDAGIVKAQKNPELLGYKLQSNAYKFSWALIPISTPFVWLLFLHRRRYRQFGAYDHAVFVT